MAKQYGEDAVRLFRRVDLRRRRESLEALSLDTSCRMGAYACTLCGEGDVTACVFLDADYRVLGKLTLREGNADEVDVESELIVSKAKRLGADRIMLCVSRRITPDEILSFNLLYRMLKNNGIVMVDLFEVYGECCHSILSDFSSCVYPAPRDDE